VAALESEISRGVGPAPVMGKVSVLGKHAGTSIYFMLGKHRAIGGARSVLHVAQPMQKRPTQRPALAV
jgi:hypothetical protein